MKPQRNNGNSLSNITYAGVLKRLFPFAQKYYRAIVISLILTVIVASLTQVTPLVIKYIVDQVTKYIELGQGLNFLISSLVVGSLILATKELVVFAANYFVGYYGEYLKIKIGTDLSNTAFSHLLSLDMSYFDSNDNEVGRLTKRVDRGIDGLSKTVKNLFVDILPLIFNATLSLIVMFSVNFWVGITASLIIPLYFYLSYTQAKKQMGVRNSIQEISENRTSTMLNVLSAIKLVKSYRRENLESNKFDIINSQLSSNEVNHHKTNRLFDGLKLLFDRIGAVLIIVVTVILILNGKASVGAITLHLLLYDNITAPIRHLHRIYDETNEAIAFAEGYFAILEAQPLLVSEKTSSPSNGCNGSLEMDNVHFSYIKGNEVLHGISFKIPAKKTVALIGLSGAGKTTIANLLGRFYDPDQGSILLDEMDLNKYPIEFIRENTGFVLQESHIFSGTIAENIRYGKETATVEEVVQAAKLAGLHEDIIKLLNGYESSARNLSGGQKQRIAIARVFLKDPPILILDEPTASLDAVTSERIQGALKALRTSRTVLIISHNLASIVDADIIYVVKEGVLVGTGTHQTLYKENEHYQKLIDANIEAMNLDKFMSVRQEKQVS